MALDALCFGAHPDDVELTSGGLAARLSAHGHAVGIVDLTRGELGTRGDVATRAAEAQAAARALGVAVRRNLELPDGALDRHAAGQLRAVVKCLREHRPALVVAPDRHDEHPDHVEASYLVARACYLAGLAKYAASGERFRPGRLMFALYRSSVAPHVVVDVSEVWPQRMAALPEVPTISEAGLPGFEVSNWWGILAPAGTPGPVVDRLHREVTAIQDSPETRKRFDLEGAEVVRMKPPQFAAFVAQETEKWTRVVKEAGIKPE